LVNRQSLKCLRARENNWLRVLHAIMIFMSRGLRPCGPV